MTFVVFLTLLCCVRPSLNQFPHDTSGRVPEFDAFHQALYMLHHYYMPENKSDRIKASADSLSLKMVALNEAPLPIRLEAKSDQFSDARTNLGESMKAFAEAVKAKKSRNMLGKSENTLHARYQVLEKVFD